MLDQAGLPDDQLFTDDLVHVNGEGYARLAGLVRDALAGAG